MVDKKKDAERKRKQRAQMRCKLAETGIPPSTAKGVQPISRTSAELCFLQGECATVQAVRRRSPTALSANVSCEARAMREEVAQPEAQEVAQPRSRRLSEAERQLRYLGLPRRQLLFWMMRGMLQ
mmetsp:Transcript_59521/g.105298  ORF Transcript_59521/g.105298 Transcript_59521/m.105298 type:complete len:125 (+) Transcript_59521:273-647(+)